MVTARQAPLKLNDHPAQPELNNEAEVPGQYTDVVPDQGFRQLDLNYHPAVLPADVEAELRGQYAGVVPTQSLRRSHEESALELHQHCVFTEASVVHSNLGNMGPDAGEETMVLRRVATHGGTTVNMIAEVTSDYYPYNSRENRMNGKFVQINAMGGTDTHLTFHLLDDATGQPVVMERFLLTVWDISDHGGEGLTNVFIGPVHGYLTAPGHQLVIKEMSDGYFSFNATRSSKDERPFDPEFQDTAMARRAVTAEFQYVISFQLRFQVAPGVESRNLILGGESVGGIDPGWRPPVQHEMLKAAKPGVKQQESGCHGLTQLDLSRLVHNNLAGKGPDNGDWNMRFDHVAEYNNSGVDLIVTIEGDYTPKQAPSSCNDTAEVRFGDFADALLRFVFVKHGGDLFGERISFNRFWFTLVDLDRTGVGSRMHVHVDGDLPYERFYTEEPSHVIVTELKEGRVVIRPRIIEQKGNKGGASSVSGLNQEERKHAVTFLINKPTSEFSFWVKVAGASEGHSLLFAGVNPFVQETCAHGA